MANRAKWSVWAKLASGASLAALAVTPAWAQDATARGAAEATQEGDIVVTGIRGSLEKAAEIKRDSAQILDVITSEDVGKLPDANVAEALQRVTGVQITRVFGEGQAVNIRGLQQVRVEVDGRTLLGWSARVSPPENDNLGRSSGLDAVPSSLFGRLEVRKSPLADQVEGGLGGTVNLVTPKPFDFKETTISLRTQGTYSDRVDKFEPDSRVCSRRPLPTAASAYSSPPNIRSVRRTCNCSNATTGSARGMVSRWAARTSSSRACCNMRMSISTGRASASTARCSSSSATIWS